MHVVVIGAGVVGASIAAGLAQRGAQVTVVERDWPGAGTSATSFAWINSNGKEPQSYFELNAAGLRAHHQLAGGASPWFVPNGHLEYATAPEHVDRLRGRMGRLVERGYPVQELTHQKAAALEPDLVIPADCDTIAFFPGEAHVFPSLYLAQALARAVDAGATVRPRTEVTALEPAGSGARVTLDDGTVLHADAVVSAAGRWSAQLGRLAGVHVPMAEFTDPGDVTVGYLMETGPLPVRVERLITSPRLNVRPDGGGRLLLQALDLDVTADPAVVPAVASELADAVLERLRGVLRNAEAADVRRLVVGQRVMPADGYTVVGRAPDAEWLYVVATHSGVTLAPLLGERVAAELFGQDEPLFADFRLERFLAGTAVTPPVPRRPGEQ
ncbi:FAD-binding oxidoreductase [uncultured Modestobacter sp.]|uniref:NAD(P)/FAD-dependent oxidoreductase n=1 Tax=uncultured Modestobacter sp. TaxID=380048 RepID=UPI0026263410|nr:FAD-binding oxidoreductase [uncultured Modestobacter sp.]